MSAIIAGASGAKVWVYLGIAVVAVLIILVVGLGMVNQSVNPQQEGGVKITSHSGTAFDGYQDVFFAEIHYTVTNFGKTGANVTVICVAIVGSDVESYSKDYYIPAGQSVSGGIGLQVTGNPDGYWTYQCYLKGETPVTYPHE
jgi:hypothetical protein